MTPGMVAAAPAVGFCLLVVIWTTRGLLRAAVWASPRGLRARLETWWLTAPPRGRITRAVSWAFVFGTMIAWLIIPLVNKGAGDGTWLLGAVIAVTALCAAVAAWERETPSAAWGLMLLAEAACLAVPGITVAGVTTPNATVPGEMLMTTTVLPYRLVALDAAGIIVALLLAMWRSGPPPIPGEAATLLAVRKWLAGLAVASAVCWWGLAFPQYGWLIAVGLAAWCGAVPLHSGMLAAHDRGSPATAMLVVGAVIPAGVIAFLDAPPLDRPWTIGLFACAAGAWCMSLRQADLRRAIGYWAAAGSCVVLAIRAQDGAARLMEAGLACGGTMATFLCGAVERDRGHREISRLRGLAARWPGGMGWMVIAGLMMTGAPPFAAFAARLLSDKAGLATAIPLAAVWLLGTACLLTMVHRVFLGQPRRDEEALDLAGRQKLVLGILCALALTSAAISH